MATTTDNVVDRVERVKHSLAGQGDPRTVQAVVDGPCPSRGCDGRVIATVHADTTQVHCDSCGSSFTV